MDRMANDVACKKKGCMFLSVFEADTYKLLKNLVLAMLPSAIQYSALTAALRLH